MNDAALLIADLRTRGVRVELEGDEIVCRAPRGTLRTDDTDALRAHKPDIVERLHAEEIIIAWRAEAMRSQVPEHGPLPHLVAVPGLSPSPGRCFSCHSPIESGLTQARCTACALAVLQAVGRDRLIGREPSPR
jgi:hypothetical protein